MKFKIMVIMMILGIDSLIAQDMDYILDKIYQQNLKQEEIDSTMADYKFRQTVDFVKLDGDGEIDEQSRREFEIFARAPNLRKRILLKAEDYEDGEWIDITEENANGRGKGESKEFTFNEMVGPEARKGYHFTYIGHERINGFDVEHIRVASLEEGEEKFNGDLWVDTNEYAVVKAELIPSEFPMGVDYMKMEINMNKIDDFWIPEKIYMQAKISFLFIFSGEIKSEISFYDYVFNQKFDDDVFVVGTH